ncbi:MAG TPA: translocation/assembly module TamB domain-containing protein, partial [Chitinophagales bacterium]
VNGSSSSMSIELLRTGDFNMRGLYEISNGKYLFTLQDIVNKPFQLSQGGTINFSGNVYKAQLNADAAYNVRTSMYDLIYDPSQVQTGLSAEAEARAKNRIVTKLLLRLTGALEKPSVTFDIVPQDPDPLIKNLVDTKLAVIRNNEAEMNKQAFGLLVMSRFIPSSFSTGDAVANGNYVSGSAINTVGQFLSSQLSRYMGTFFESVGIKGLDINMNFQQYDQQTNQNSSLPSATSQYDTRRELQLALTQRLLSNRLSISAGGNVDFGDKTTTNNGTASTAWTTNVNGNFQVEYSLTKSGALRARAFNIGSYDNLRQQNVNKTGLGVSYRQDFDNLREIFRKRKKKQADSNKIETPANITTTKDSVKHQ